MRRVLGVIAGLVVAFVLVQVAELITHQLYPFPPGADMHDMATIKRFVATLPPPAFVLVLAGWLAGTFLGTFVAAKIGRSRVASYILGAILLAAGIANAIIIPQPAWFSIASIGIYVGGTLIGAKLGTPRRAPL